MTAVRSARRSVVSLIVVLFRQLNSDLANYIKKKTVTVTTTAEGIAQVLYDTDIKRGKVISAYIISPTSRYYYSMFSRSATTTDRFYLMCLNYDLSKLASISVDIEVVYFT